ncbi:hypothetical protein BC332_08875 [Capsicum chinense]|nr:hypothetical protein BC332_08875 [Capsicum chinense]
MISLLTLFTLIIASIIYSSIILKQETESKSLSFNPIAAITSVCDLISEDSYSCFDSIASFYYAQTPSLDKISPFRIFIFSLYASRIELENVAASLQNAMSGVHVNPKSVGVLRNCQGMIEFSLKQINEAEMSLGVDPDEKIWGVNEVVWDLQRWVGEAMGKVQTCVDLSKGIPENVRVEIREKSIVALQNLRNSKGILQNVDEIFGLFYPRIGSALGSLVWEFEYGLTVWLFCFGYLAINEEKNSTAIMTMRAEMIDWLYNEGFNITGCLNWLAYEKGLETENANNCLSILENMNNISEMLDPSINSVFDFDAFRRSGRSIVDLLFSDWAIFGVQFIYWMLLVCMLVRAW